MTIDDECSILSLKTNRYRSVTLLQSPSWGRPYLHLSPAKRAIVLAPLFLSSRQVPIIPKPSSLLIFFVFFASFTLNISGLSQLIAYKVSAMKLL